MAETLIVLLTPDETTEHATSKQRLNSPSTFTLFLAISLGMQPKIAGRYLMIAVICSYNLTHKYIRC